MTSSARPRHRACAVWMWAPIGHEESNGPAPRRRGGRAVRREPRRSCGARRPAARLSGPTSQTPEWVEWIEDRWVPDAMTESSDTHDQDADPPTPDGEEPDTEQLQPDSEPASHPDPDPDAGTTQTRHEEDA